MLVGGKRPKSILFCREKHEEREIWDGYRYGPKAAKAASVMRPTPSSNSTRSWPELLVDAIRVARHRPRRAWDAHRQGAERRAGANPVPANAPRRHPRPACRAGRHAPGQDAAEGHHAQRAADIASAGRLRHAPAARHGLNTNWKPS